MRGGKDYKEIVIWDRTVEPYQPDTVHFTDVGGGRALVWIRAKLRTDRNGNQVLHIEEVQSKRFQDAIERGGFRGEVPQVGNELPDNYKIVKIDKIEPISLPSGQKIEDISWQLTGKDRYQIKYYLGNSRDKLKYGNYGERFARQEYSESGYGQADIVEKYGQAVWDNIECGSNAFRGDPIGSWGEMSISDKYILYKDGTRLMTGAQTTEGLARWQGLKDAVKDRMEKNEARPPAAPFEKNWHEVGVKRALRYAAENGIPTVTFSTGQAQIERYDLRNYVDEVLATATMETSATSRLGEYIKYQVILNKDGERVDKHTFSTTEGMTATLGKSLTKKILTELGPLETGVEKAAVIKGDDLNFGGEGMYRFYDEIIPSFINSYYKSNGWQGEVTPTEIDVSETRTGLMRHRYVGPNYTVDQLVAGYEKMSKFGMANLMVSPFTGREGDTAYNRSLLLIPLQKIILELRQFPDHNLATAMLSEGTHSLAEMFGGKLEPIYEPSFQVAHSIDITPEMAESVLYSGQPMFSVERESDDLFNHANDEASGKSEQARRIDARKVEDNPDDIQAIDEVYKLRPWEDFILRYVMKDGRFNDQKFFDETGIVMRTKDHKDLSKWLRRLTTMQDLARNHPEMQALFETQKERVAHANQLSVKDGHETKAYFSLPKESAAKVNKALDWSDAKNRRISNKDLKEKWGLNEAEVKAYWAVRENLDKKRDFIVEKMLADISRDVDKIMAAEIRKQLNKRNDAVTRGGDAAAADEKLISFLNGLTKEVEVKKDTLLSKAGDMEEVAIFDDAHIQQVLAIADWADARRAYMPHQWKSEWVVRVQMKKKDATDKTEKAVVHEFEVPSKMAEYLPTKSLRGKAAQTAARDVVIQRLGSMAGVEDVLVIHQTDYPVDMFEGVRGAAMNNIVTQAFEKYDSEMDDEGGLKDLGTIREEIKKHIQEMYLARGWGRHLIPRKGTLGYRTDFENILPDYMNGFNNFVAKGEAAIKFADDMKGINAKNTPQMWTHAKEYISDMLGASEGEAGWYKTAVGTWFLGLDVSAAALNMTQNWTHANALLKGLKAPGSTESELYRAMVDVYKEYRAARKEGRRRYTLDTTVLTRAEVRAFESAYDAGTLDPQMFGEIVGLHKDKIYDRQEIYDSIKRKVFMAFTGSESWNRMSTFLAAYRRATKAGLAKELAVAKATEITEGAHFVYGKSNRPEIIRKAGWIGNMAYTFMTYPVNNIIFLKHRIQDVMSPTMSSPDKKTAMKVIGANLAALFAFGGLNALPFWFLGKLAYSIFTDPEDDYEKLLHKYLGKYPARGIVRGLPAVFGNDLSWRVEGTDILGLPVGASIAKQFYQKIGKAQKAASEHDYSRALFTLAPDFVRNPYNAVAGYLWGGTRPGYPIIKYTPYEAATKALGFSPTREAEAQQLNRIFTEKKLERNKQLEVFAEDYLYAKNNRDYKAMSEVRKNVMDYNTKERAKGSEGLPIKMDTVRQSAKTRDKARETPPLEHYPKYMKKMRKAGEAEMDLSAENE